MRDANRHVPLAGGLRAGLSGGDNREAGMAICWTGIGNRGAKMGVHGIVAAALGIAVAAMLAWTSPANAATGTPSKTDQQCLACHGAQGLQKKLASGETLSLHVDAGSYAQSVHSSLGCAVCHGDVTMENHPPLKKKITSVRENSLALQKVCSACHADKFKLYQGSIHATLLREGNPIAPVCTDCHSAHAMMPKASFNAATGAPCSKCHAPIQEAWAGSVHGVARKQGNTAAPVCSTCHSAHDVKPAAGEDKLRFTCFGCHGGALQAHQKWLPNAQRHLNTVSCSACHVPGSKRRVDLRLYDTGEEGRYAEKEGVPLFDLRTQAIDTGKKGLDEGELKRLLDEFDQDRMRGSAILRGRLEVDGAVEVHQLAQKSKASAQCESCHSTKSAAFEKVTVSVRGPDGRPLRYEVDQDVLTSARSVESVGGFYVIGGTRIKLLDAIVVLALVAGIAGPLMHLALSWLFRRNAKRIGGREDS